MAAWLFGGSSQTPLSEYEALLESVTSDLLPTPSLDGLPPDLLDQCLKMSDLIRSGQIKASEGVKGFRKRLAHTNPNVQLLALLSLDVAIKNSGDSFLREVATGNPPAISTSTDAALTDSLALLARSANGDVRMATLRLLQNWATAFETKPYLAITPLVLLYRRLRAEGFTFPPKDPSATASMIDSMAAPEWVEADVCSRCRDAFSITNRRHHCRNCGQIFDHKCSTKKMALPHFGITQEVRVCDGCHKKLFNHGGRRASVSSSVSSPRITVPNRSSSVRLPTSRLSDSAMPDEDADLQLALRLSLADNHAAGRSGYQPNRTKSRTRTTKESTLGEAEDPELAAAIEASLRELRAPHPSAPEGASTHVGPVYEVPAALELAPRDHEALMNFVNMTVQRRHSSQDIAPYFASASAARAGLLRVVADTGRREQILIETREKLSHAVRLYDGLLESQIARHTQQVAVQHKAAGPETVRLGGARTEYTTQQLEARDVAQMQSVHLFGVASLPGRYTSNGMNGTLDHTAANVPSTQSAHLTPDQHAHMSLPMSAPIYPLMPEQQLLNGPDGQSRLRSSVQAAPALSSPVAPMRDPVELRGPPQLGANVYMRTLQQAAAQTPQIGPSATVSSPVELQARMSKVYYADSFPAVPHTTPHAAVPVLTQQVSSTAREEALIDL